MKSKTGVDHWVDGEGTWSLGIQGFLIQIKGVVLQALPTIPLMGAPFWWPAKEGGKKIFLVDFNHILFATGILILILLISGAFYLRKRVKRSLKLKAQLHLFTHGLRDALNDTLERTNGKQGRPSTADPAHHRAHIRNISNKAAEAISEYLSTITGDDTVGCAIRLAQDKLGDGKDEIHYVTVGRSQRLNPNRGSTSESIARNEGIPKFFLADERSSQGILFFHDLVKATATGCYKTTRNDELHGNDFTSMVVMPLNGWNGKKKDLIGLVCVTSKNQKSLQTRHIDLFKFTSDTLALFYVAVISRLQSVGKMPQLTEIPESDSEVI